MDLGEAVKVLLRSQEYSFSVIGPKLKGKWLYGASGVRIMGRDAWRGVLAEITPSSALLTFPAELDAGADEAMTGQWGVPSGRYWHTIDRLARQAATVIVAEELADESTAASRKLLTLLPDGSGANASSALVLEQVRAVWQRLTTKELKATDPTYDQLQTLWSAVKSKKSGEFRAAWRTLLVAMLTHPTFVTY